MAVLLVACLVLIAAVFAVSAFTKLRSRVAFRSFAASLVMVPGRIRLPVAAAVAGAEAAVPVLMVVPRLGLAMSGALLIGFSAAIAVSMRRGMRVRCRCFGASALPLGPVHLVRNGLLLLAVVLGCVGLLASDGRVPAAALAVAVPAGLVGAVVFAVFDDIADLFVKSSGSA